MFGGGKKGWSSKPVAGENLEKARTMARMKNPPHARPLSYLENPLRGPKAGFQLGERGRNSKKKKRGKGKSQIRLGMKRELNWGKGGYLNSGKNKTGEKKKAGEQTVGKTGQKSTPLHRGAKRRTPGVSKMDKKSKRDSFAREGKGNGGRGKIPFTFDCRKTTEKQR